MLMIRTNIKRTTAVPIRASLWRPLEYPISITILVVIVLTPDVKESGKTAWLPATMITAIVSPIARPIPKMTDAKIPRLAYHPR